MPTPEPEARASAVERAADMLSEYATEAERAGMPGHWIDNIRETRRALLASTGAGAELERAECAALADRLGSEEIRNAILARALPEAAGAEMASATRWAWEDLHPATADLVRRFANALAEKLAAAERKYGYSDGWLDPTWMDECREKLRAHVEKGDPRDVAAYCAFLWHHGEPTIRALPEAAPAPPAEPAGAGRCPNHNAVEMRCVFKPGHTGRCSYLAPPAEPAGEPDPFRTAPHITLDSAASDLHPAEEELAALRARVAEAQRERDEARAEVFENAKARDHQWELRVTAESRLRRVEGAARAVGAVREHRHKMSGSSYFEVALDRLAAALLPPTPEPIAKPAISGPDCLSTEEPDHA